MDEENDCAEVGIDEEDSEPINVTQYALLCYLTSSSEIWTLAEPILQPSYFDDEYKAVVQFCMDYRNKYFNLPSKLQIRGETGVRLETPEDVDEDHIKNWLTNEIETHCRTRALYEALKEGSMRAQGDDSRSTAAMIEAKMKQVLCMTIRRDLGVEIHADMKSALQRAQANSGLSCGIPHLDDALDGGFYFKSVNMFVLASGQGKSVLLANIAYNYAKLHMFNVVYISLELDEDMIQKRFAAITTGIDVRETFSKADWIDKELKMRMVGKNKKEGHLFVKKMPMDGTTVADIEAYVQDLSMRTGLVFHVCAVDYLDLVNPKDKTIRLDNIHMKDKRTSIELHDFMERLNMIGLTASQRLKGSEDTKDGNGNDIESQGHVSGGTDKVNTVDNLIFGRRNDKEKTEGKMRLTLKKTRNSAGDGKIIPVNFNNNNLIISGVSDEEYAKYSPFSASNIVKNGNKYKRDDGISKIADEKLKDLQNSIATRKNV